MIPTHQALMAPFLGVLQDGQPHRSADVASILSRQLDLAADELELLLPSGKLTVWRSRVHWASQYLSQAGAITRVQRGVFVIADRGRALLAAHPDGVSTADLMQFPEFVDFVNRSKRPTSVADAAAAPAGDLSPQERMEAAASELEAAVAAELLQRINAQPPAFLERVVLELLIAMGYAGALGRADHLGGSGDEGVDGVLRQDPLGLDLVYVQAKRYASGKVVGRPEIQAFVGALQGAQATRGVFITTSRFSAEGVTYADRVTQRVVLLDGQELTRLMVQHGVGVQTDQTYVLRRVDEDFFDLELPAAVGQADTP